MVVVIMVKVVVLVDPEAVVLVDLLVILYPQMAEKVFTLRGYMSEGGDGDILDPYGDSLDVFRCIYSIIEEEIDRVLPHIIEAASGEEE